MMIDQNRITAEWLREFRRRQGWSQAQLGDALNMTQGAISLLEQGKRGIEGPIVPLLIRMNRDLEAQEKRRARA
jgi:transcriptional regulator with XRE-family HTH domain